MACCAVGRCAGSRLRQRIIRSHAACREQAARRGGGGRQRLVSRGQQGRQAPAAQGPPAAAGARRRARRARRTAARACGHSSGTRGARSEPLTGRSPEMISQSRTAAGKGYKGRREGGWRAGISSAARAARARARPDPTSTPLARPPAGLGRAQQGKAAARLQRRRCLQRWCTFGCPAAPQAQSCEGGERQARRARAPAAAPRTAGGGGGRPAELGRRWPARRRPCHAAHHAKVPTRPQSLM